MTENTKVLKRWVRWATDIFNIPAVRAESLLRKHEMAAQDSGFPTSNGVRCTNLQKMEALLRQELQ